VTAEQGNQSIAGLSAGSMKLATYREDHSLDVPHAVAAESWIGPDNVSKRRAAIRRKLNLPV
jgi:hypothetical protein